MRRVLNMATWRRMGRPGPGGYAPAQGAALYGKSREAEFANYAAGVPRRGLAAAGEAAQAGGPSELAAG
jgi:hypothetical protein